MKLCEKRSAGAGSSHDGRWRATSFVVAWKVVNSAPASIPTSFWMPYTVHSTTACSSHTKTGFYLTRLSTPWSMRCSADWSPMDVKDGSKWQVGPQTDSQIVPDDGLPFHNPVR